MGSIGESLINAIENVIATREDKVLECMLEFQNHVIEELISIRQLLKQRCLNSVGKNGQHNCACKCPLLYRNSYTFGLFEKSSRSNFNETYCNSFNEESDHVKEESADVFQKDASHKKELKDSFIENEMLDDMYPPWLKLGAISVKQHSPGALSHNTKKSDVHTKDIFRNFQTTGVTVFNKNDSSLPLQTEIDADMLNKQSLSMLKKEKGKKDILKLPDSILNPSCLFNADLSSITDYNDVSVNNSNINTLHFEKSKNNDKFILKSSDDYLLKHDQFTNSKSVKSRLHSNFSSVDHKKKDYRRFEQDGTKKQYKCSVCGKHFSSKSTVQKHAKLHDGVKPYSCKLCGKSFSEKFSLKRHLMIHTGEKPFKCTICNKSYSRKDYRDLHMKLHWDNILSKKKCKENISTEN